jgi:hypothetical protein
MVEHECEYAVVKEEKVHDGGRLGGSHQATPLPPWRRQSRVIRAGWFT